MRTQYTLLKRSRFILLTIIAVLSVFPAMNANSNPGDNMIIPRKKGAIGIETTPESIFPHWIHRARYRCDACHNDLFEMELGATEISKELMKKKQSCAICHNGKLAFEVGFSTCYRCHVAKEE